MADITKGSLAEDFFSQETYFLKKFIWIHYLFQILLFQ